MRRCSVKQELRECSIIDLASIRIEEEVNGKQSSTRCGPAVPAAQNHSIFCHPHSAVMSPLSDAFGERRIRRLKHKKASGGAFII
jgi:hypothetical protein